MNCRRQARQKHKYVLSFSAYILHNAACTTQLLYRLQLGVLDDTGDPSEDTVVQVRIGILRSRQQICLMQYG